MAPDYKEITCMMSKFGDYEKNDGIVKHTNTATLYHAIKNNKTAHRVEENEFAQKNKLMISIR